MQVEDDDSDIVSITLRHSVTYNTDLEVNSL
jgi:hypothetical protein